VTAERPHQPAAPETPADPDRELVARVRGGDVAGFEALMRRHNRRLFRVALAILGDADEAEDVMQETYLRAFAALAQFAGAARFATWLVRIAVHEALARRRRRQPHAHDDADAVLDDALGPADAAGAAELGALIEAAVARLPAPFRVVFVLRAVEQLSVQETAACLGIDEATVKTRAFRARALLRGLLARHATDVAPRLFDLHLARCDRVVAHVLPRVSNPPPPCAP
jgi:RNA polymerase sigma-70 factor (ECF subfamily)